MKKYHLRCPQCGKDFMADRNDAKYCSNSCRAIASKQRKDTTLTIEYTEDEIQQLNTVAKIAGLSTETLVKHKSILTGVNIQRDKKKIEGLKAEIASLKAHLSIFTNEIEQKGFYIKVEDEEELDFLHYILSEAFPDLTFNEAVLETLSKFKTTRDQRDMYEEQFDRYKDLYDDLKNNLEQEINKRVTSAIKENQKKWF